MSDDDLGKIVFPSAKLTLYDVLYIVLAFCLRFHLSDVAKIELIKMIKLFAGPEMDNFNVSKYQVNKIFSPPDRIVIYHYWCQCKEKIIYSVTKNQFKTCKVICQKCGHENQINHHSTNYFTMVDIIHQLKKLFSCEKLKNYLLEYMSSLKGNLRNFSGIRDVYDSELFAAINSGAEKYVTYIVSTDGAPLNHSGKRSFWPLQIMLNCFPMKLRSANVLLAGMLFCSKEPDSHLMNLYFEKFQQYSDYLFHQGIDILDSCKKVITIKFCFLACSVDSVCRPLVQNRLQYNGFFGCSWCYHHGMHVKKLGVRYPIEETNYLLRTHESHNRDVKAAKESGKHVNGVKGSISLQNIHCIDMVWSFPYEYMHGVLCGVDKYLFKRLVVKKLFSKFKLTKEQQRIINSRIMCIAPPQEIHRLPRLDRSIWKASEVKSWLLYYCLPCLQGILSQEALDHYALLVRSIFTLLKENITKNDLLQCQCDLTKFVVKFEMYYGIEGMAFNVHSLLHAVESVMKTGPLWVTSTFPFESNIYNLKKCVTGPKGMDEQMCKKSLQLLEIKYPEPKESLSVDTIQFTKNLFSHKRLLPRSYTSDNEGKVIFVGKCHKEKFDSKMCCVYKKCIVNGTVYHSKSYTAAERSDN